MIVIFHGVPMVAYGSSWVVLSFVIDKLTHLNQDLTNVTYTVNLSTTGESSVVKRVK